MTRHHEHLVLTLRSFSLFSALSPTALSQLASSARSRALEPLEHAPTGSVTVLLDGALALIRPRAGKQAPNRSPNGDTVARIYAAPAVIGAVLGALSPPRPRALTAVALRQSHVASVPNSVFAAFVNQFDLWESLLRRSATLVEVLTSRAMDPPPSRAQQAAAYLWLFWRHGFEVRPRHFWTKYLGITKGAGLKRVHEALREHGVRRNRGEFYREVGSNTRLREFADPALWLWSADYTEPPNRRHS